ncbi:MAG: hypothetical protein GY909_17715 [Oligoflexia bacterium]|nr:hypothetical protein [Oligoflexia bacterium]
MLNESNWNYCSYISNDLKVFIALAAQPDTSGDQELLYSVTSITKEDVEVFQQDFKLLDEAISFANRRYGHWDFIDPLTGNTGSGSGCGSCEAH